MPTKRKELSSSSSDMVEVKLPPFKKPSSYTPVLVVILIILSFVLGMLVTKVQYLESNKTATAQPSTQNQGNPPAQTITNNDIKKWAKEVGVDTKKFNECFDTNKYKTQVDTDAADGRTAGVGGTPTFFINGEILIGAQPFEAFKEVIDRATNGTVNNPVKVDVGHLPLLGNKDAKVTVIEFSDLQCPYCKNFFTSAFPQIKKEYIDTGKIAFYFRHFPLEFHPLARPFADAVECAQEQGKFWEMHDKIFDSQQ